MDSAVPVPEYDSWEGCESNEVCKDEQNPEHRSSDGPFGMSGVDWGEPGNLLCVWVDNDANDGTTTLPQLPIDAYTNIESRCNYRGKMFASVIDGPYMWIMLTTVDGCKRLTRAVNDRVICEGKYMARVRHTNTASWAQAPKVRQLAEVSAACESERSVYHARHAGARTGGNRHKARKLR
jgi:hypothetical protein